MTALDCRPWTNPRSTWKALRFRTERNRALFYKSCGPCRQELIQRSSTDFTFRGSLGPTIIGHEQFAGYVDWVDGAFDQYTTTILVMIEKAPRQRQDAVHFPSQGMFGCPEWPTCLWTVCDLHFEDARCDLFVLATFTA